MEKLIEHQHGDSTSEEVDVSQAKLKDLLEGKLVIYTVSDSRMLPKKRVVKPLLFLVPEALTGMEGKLVVALWGQGCEVLDTTKPIKPLNLHMAGLSIGTAKVLSEALNTLFNRGE